jgi:hypothetical protein
MLLVRVELEFEDEVGDFDLRWRLRDPPNFTMSCRSGGVTKPTRIRKVAVEGASGPD